MHKNYPFSQILPHITNHVLPLPSLMMIVNYKGALIRKHFYVTTVFTFCWQAKHTGHAGQSPREKATLSLHTPPALSCRQQYSSHKYWLYTKVFLQSPMTVIIIVIFLAFLHQILHLMQFNQYCCNLRCGLGRFF